MAKSSKMSAAVASNIKPVMMIVLGYVVVTIIIMFLLPIAVPSIFESYSEWLNGKVSGGMVQSKVATPTEPPKSAEKPRAPPELTDILTKPGQQMVCLCTHDGCGHCQDFIKAGLHNVIEEICKQEHVPFAHAKKLNEYPTLNRKQVVEYFPQCMKFTCNDDGTISKESHEGGRNEEEFKSFIQGRVQENPKAKGVNAMLSIAEDESVPLPGIRESMAKPDISISNNQQMPLHGPSSNNVESSQDSGSNIDIAAVQPAASSGFARRGSGVPFSE